MKEFLSKTYLVCNSYLLAQLRQIEGFSINLGQSLLNQAHEYNPADINIQMHRNFFDEQIQLIGFLGSLQIYTSYRQPVSVVSVVNEKHKVDSNLEGNKTLYATINEALKSMALITGYTVKTENKIKIEKDEVYVRPDKKLEEMSMAERIQFARNRQ